MAASPRAFQVGPSESAETGGPVAPGTSREASLEHGWINSREVPKLRNVGRKGESVAGTTCKTLALFYRAACRYRGGPVRSPSLMCAPAARVAGPCFRAGACSASSTDADAGDQVHPRRRTLS
jgi:hypothetical protein